MGLFKKKDEVPKLPPAPTLPDLPQPMDKRDLPELPSFPQSSRNENLNQELVKSAVSDELSAPMGSDAAQFPSLPPRDPGLVPPRPMDVDAPVPPVQSIPDLPHPDLSRPVTPSDLTLNAHKSREVQGFEDRDKPMTRASEPLFVRIDKFQSSQESFTKILGKVKEIESTLEKLRKVKSREDEEIGRWASEIEELKSRLGDIDENIFSQI